MMTDIHDYKHLHMLCIASQFFKVVINIIFQSLFLASISVLKNLLIERVTESYACDHHDFRLQLCESQPLEISEGALVKRCCQLLPLVSFSKGSSGTYVASKRQPFHAKMEKSTETYKRHMFYKVLEVLHFIAQSIVLSKMRITMKNHIKALSFCSLVILLTSYVCIRF